MTRWLRFWPAPTLGTAAGLMVAYLGGGVVASILCAGMVALPAAVIHALTMLGDHGDDLTDLRATTTHLSALAATQAREIVRLRTDHTTLTMRQDRVEATQAHLDPPTTMVRRIPNQKPRRTG